jgi:hypothetical protein
MSFFGASLLKKKSCKGDQEKKWIMKDKREKQRIEERFSPYGKVPKNSGKKQYSHILQKKETGTVPGNKKRTPVASTNTGGTVISRTPVASTNTAGPIISLDDSTDEVMVIGREEHLVCPVLYCEVKFTSRDLFKQHMEDFDHSPINPCLENPNGTLTVTQQYVCTNCGRCFKVGI